MAAANDPAGINCPSVRYKWKKTGNEDIPFKTDDGCDLLWTVELPEAYFTDTLELFDLPHRIYPCASVVAVRGLPPKYYTKQFEQVRSIKIEEGYVQNVKGVKKEDLLFLMGSTLMSKNKLIRRVASVEEYFKVHGQEEAIEFDTISNWTKMVSLIKGKNSVLYPYGVRHSLLEPDENHLINLKTPINGLTTLRISKDQIDGVAAPYIYFGVSGSSFPIHCEDENFESINLMMDVVGLLNQGVKIWVAFHLGDQEKLIREIRKTYPRMSAEQLGKNVHINDLELLAKKGIRMQLIVQRPGTMIITFGMHTGLNIGNCINEAQNVCTERWMEMQHVKLPFDGMLSHRYEGWTSIQVKRDLKKDHIMDGYEASFMGVPMLGRKRTLFLTSYFSQYLRYKYQRHFEGFKIYSDLSSSQKNLFFPSIVFASFELQKDLNSVKGLRRVRKGMGIATAKFFQKIASFEPTLQDLDSMIESKEATTMFAEKLCALFDTDQTCKEMLHELSTCSHQLINNGVISQLLDKERANVFGNQPRPLLSRANEIEKFEYRQNPFVVCRDQSASTSYAKSGIISTSNHPEVIKVTPGCTTSNDNLRLDLTPALMNILHQDESKLERIKGVVLSEGIRILSEEEDRVKSAIKELAANGHI